MKWQDKLKAFCRDHPMSVREMARRAGTSAQNLGAALDSDTAWATVQTAIEIAKTMGTTVEYLFDEKTDWPMGDSDHARPLTNGDETPVGGAVSKAIAALERMGASAELAKLTSELLRAGASEDAEKAQKARRTRKR